MKALDFIYNRKLDKYDMSPYKTDADLIRKIQTGKGDPIMYEGYGNNLFIEIFFSGTTPNAPK